MSGKGKKGRKWRIKRKYIVNYDKMGKLLSLAIRQHNEKLSERSHLKERNRWKLAVFAREYMRTVVREISEQPVCHPFYTSGISHVQVLQVESNKGYAWDQKYNMRDFEIVMHHKYPHAKVIFDEALLGTVLQRAEKGEVYMDEISAHTKILTMGLKDAIFDTLKGNFVHKDVKAYRLKECNVCPNNVAGICSKCVCNISWKVSMPKEECPIGEWPKVQ